MSSRIPKYDEDGYEKEVENDDDVDHDNDDEDDDDDDYHGDNDDDDEDAKLGHEALSQEADLKVAAASSAASTQRCSFDTRWLLSNVFP